MEELFNSIRESYNLLWHIKVLGESIEIITPMITTKDSFVSVFITQRGDSYVVTDGGWISAGYYGCDLNALGKVYNKLLQYYIDSYQILQTIGHGRILYYKKVKDRNLVVNAVFELSNFISAVVSGSNIQFQSDKKEVRFRRTVRDYLLNTFDEGTFRFSQKLTDGSSIEYTASSNFAGHLQLLNIVTGSSPSYYRDSLLRSNFYFEAARIYADRLKINKTIALLDDTTPSIFNSPQVTEFIELSRGIEGNIMLPWSNKGRLLQDLVS